MYEQPLVSYIVPTYNGADTIADCLSSIQAQDYSQREVIVVDDGSDDGIQEIVENQFPTAEVIAFPDNAGVCRASNSGFKAATGKYAAVLDQDAKFIEEDAVSQLVARFEAADDDVALISPRIEEPSGAALNVDGEISAYHGAGFIARRQCLKEAGYYDERLYLYGNEVDMTAKLWNRGYRLIGYPAVGVAHQHDSKVFSRSWTRREHFYVPRNFLWLNWKYLSLRTALPASTVGLLPFLQRALHDGDLTTFFRGVFSAFKGLPGCLRRREHCPKLDRLARQGRSLDDAGGEDGERVMSYRMPDG